MPPTRSAFLLLALFVAAGCNSAFQRCVETSDCSAQAWCETAVGVCVSYARPEDGTGCADGGTQCAGGGAGGGTATGGGTAAGAGTACTGGGGAGDGGVCPPEICSLVVVITSPAALTTATNGTIHLAVSVTGGAPASVTLRANNVTIATVAPPFTYDWDTTTWVEGSYQLLAQAEGWGRSYVSLAKTMKVDRTPPKVVSQLPAPSATNVWSRDAITVTFDEPIAGKSLDSNSARYFVGGATQAASLSLSPDIDTGPTLTFAPYVLPDVSSGSATVGVGLENGITDLAGNHLAPLVWTWSVPAWQDLGTASSVSFRASLVASLAVDSSGAPVLAARSLSTEGHSVRLVRWDGSGWRSMPSTPFGAVLHPSAPALDADALGNLALAYVDARAGDVHAAFWDGTGWRGDAVLDVAQSAAARAPAIHFGADARPMAAWIEPDGAIDQVHAALWSGSDWRVLSGPGPLTSSATDVAVSVTLDKSLVVSWYTDVLTRAVLHAGTYRSGAWALSGWTLGSAMTIGPARINTDGSPLVAWIDPTVPEQGYLSTFTGFVWRPLGDSSLNLDQARPIDQVALAARGANSAVVVWTERNTSATAVHAKRWDGSAWRQLGTNLYTGTSGFYAPPSNPVVAVSPAGVVAASYYEESPSRHWLTVKRFNQ